MPTLGVSTTPVPGAVALTREQLARRLMADGKSRAQAETVIGQAMARHSQRELAEARQAERRRRARKAQRAARKAGRR